MPYGATYGYPDDGANSAADRNTDPHANTSADSDTSADGNTSADVCGNRHSNTHSGGDPNADSDDHPGCSHDDSDAGSDTNVYSYAYSDADQCGRRIQRRDFGEVAHPLLSDGRGERHE